MTRYPGNDGKVHGMKFRDDIDPATTWVTADSHFGHQNIRTFCHRPDDIENTMMEEWAQAVPVEGSTLLHLGDLCYRGNAQFKNLIAPHLTGERKLLIMGNHDRQRYSFYRDCGFKLARPFALAFQADRTTGGFKLIKPDSDGWVPDYGGLVVSFSHYPWNYPDFEGRKQEEWDIRLHGHIHNNGYSRHEYTPFLKGHINLSVEQTKYRPVNLKALIEATARGKLVDTGPDWYAGDAE